ncbi:MAG: biotin transporter BioY [Candidatus Nanopelagicales bacterium]|nr:biotin transporter BioY [Candidatus Nanopelagicales bacterium]
MSTQAVTGVIVDSWATQSRVRNAILVMGLTGFTALAAQISIPLPFTPVPLTLQTFAVLAGAAALGAERAVIAQVLYITLAVAGVPVLAGGASGHEVVVGATGGYLIGFVLASYVVGRISSNGASTKSGKTALAFLAGSVLIYALGAPWLAFTTGNTITWAIVNGVVPFLVGDLIKAVAAGAVLPLAWKITKSK